METFAIHCGGPCPQVRTQPLRRRRGKSISRRAQWRAAHPFKCPMCCRRLSRWELAWIGVRREILPVALDARRPYGAFFHQFPGGPYRPEWRQ